MNHKITLERAIEMTTLFRNEKDQILKPELVGKDLLPRCETFDREAIDRLLAQPECAKLRIYYGMDQELKIHAILVGVNANDADILPNRETANTIESTVDGDDEEEILEEAFRCPPVCPPPSDLNP